MRRRLNATYCSPQTHQLLWCHHRETRPGPSLGAAVCPFHLHQPSSQPGAVRPQLPVVGQGGLPAGRYCLLPLFALSINILIHLLIPSKPTLGLESPTHALRADADPSAQSASATYITLAQEHPYDRHIEIILHLSGEKLGMFSSLIFAHLTSSMLCYYPQKLTAHWSY